MRSAVTRIEQPPHRLAVARCLIELTRALLTASKSLIAQKSDKFYCELLSDVVPTLGARTRTCRPSEYELELRPRGREYEAGSKLGVEVGCSST